jgi:pimeloyl-ACP methyl ester carboxylesterase
MGGAIASLLAAACPERVTRLLAIEAIGTLAETPEQTVPRLRDALAAQRALRDKRLRVFPDVESAVRARQFASRVPGSGLGEAEVRLLVARGLRAVDGGYTWSSDPRLTLPTLVRMTEAQVEALVAGIACPVRAIFADPAQPYLPDALRRSRTRLLPAGEIVVMPGGHHLHMQQPAEVAAAIGDFLRGG